MAGVGLGGALTSPSPSQSASVRQRQLFEAAKASASLYFYLSSLNNEASGNGPFSTLTVNNPLNDCDISKRIHHCNTNSSLPDSS